MGVPIQVSSLTQLWQIIEIIYDLVDSEMLKFAERLALLNFSNK
ncbi:MAG: hypothetical protein ACI9JN_002900 [Bacteroidia bacterium]|jgi:hypothetical protein